MVFPQLLDFPPPIDKLKSGPHKCPRYLFSHSPLPLSSPNRCFGPFKIIHLFIFMYMDILSSVCVSFGVPCLVSMEARRRCWILWNWRYKWFWATMWVLQIEPQSFRKVVGSDNPWAISPGQCYGLWVGWIEVFSLFQDLFQQKS